MDGTLCSHLGVKPHHVLLRDGCVHAFAKGHDVVLARPDPETAHDAAQGDGAGCKADELERCYAHGVQEGVFGGLWGVGCERELCKSVESLANDEGHEWGDRACDKRGQDGGNEEEEDVTAGDEGEEETE
jgi:hypothetical protein